ncbi:FAD/NAD(P)-binding domain-containing protein [Cryphonectria parasitica EP155]|uniref:FAD/NAD(P)-binding domain-containing protein n=1 Tax=Cryphonectria parasitica (strain ATCC 38755 / EP155) TaxID=660469 RepID=A0A9P4YC17_CRYP1|nr:FAD/NAD(P)-binding domain-containing protein [Cryphonectria parasitica EP155]KAF3770112.1 FAD/NAD(P)-binding domain-containing protein [Cryphonectria parasitica EP155]
MALALRHPNTLARTVLSVSRIRYFSSFRSDKNGKKERVVILGSGWAGYAFARSLDPSKYERIIVSPRSYFVFTPLLASTAVGTLEFRTTLESVRRLGKNVRFYQGWADDVDFERKVVRVEENVTNDPSTSRTNLPLPPQAQGNGEEGVKAVIPKGPVTDLSYDKLVIAVGAYSQTFGIEGVRQHAHFLRDIGDARRIRLRVLSLFEQCTSHAMKSSSTADEARRKLLHFAIVGGGPTGIEYAAELHDLVRDDLSKIYPNLMPHVRITVYDISPKILPMFDQALASYAMRLFSRQGISVRTKHSIQSIAPDPDTGGLRLRIKEAGEEEIGAGMVVWSTGLMQNPLVEKLVQKTLAGEGASHPSEYRLEKDPKTGGIIVDEQFRARLANSSSSSSGAQQQLLSSVFVIGDCAVVASQPDLPKTAQVASQEAAHLARTLNRHNAAAGEVLSETAKPFRFKNLGTMTYLGNWKAIHQSSADRLTGWAAWVLWRTAYLTRSMSLRNKVLVPVYWFVSWMFGRDIGRF